ncbi:hypothetical protein M9Y10_016125 [Tritrichomonas musculus]|uniref:DUF362 domain-containing protein n=1 Tax=Tritrichomonas musculus TaxID=1915356 RepID=A0ABR2I782_9EUKA
MSKATVYFTKEITPEAIIKLYKALNHPLPGKVAVKISTGEFNNPHYLAPKLIKPIIDELHGTIVECNTAYPGKRDTTKDHWHTIEAHGFKAIAPCDIMDEEKEMSIPVKDGFHLKENFVGEHLKNYNSILMLSHFKGHPMGGYGGALKNMSIGIASSYGKSHIHCVGDFHGKFEELFHQNQDHFLESMADADRAVVDYMKGEIVYINVANNLSIDCDCVDKPKPPEMKDIGIYASVDPVALDQACCDAIINSDDPGKKSFVERLNKQHGLHLIEAAEKLGLGTRQYEIVNL